MKVLVFFNLFLAVFTHGYAQQTLIPDINDSSRMLQVRFCELLNDKDSLAALSTFAKLLDNPKNGISNMVMNRGVFLYEALENSPKATGLVQQLVTSIKQVKKRGFLNSSHFAENGVCPDFSIIDISPAYEGGREALYSHISNTFEINESDSIEYADDRVFIQFVVNTDGAIGKFSVVKGSRKLGALFISTLKKVPNKWSSGFCNCQPRPTKLIMPFAIHLE